MAAAPLIGIAPNFDPAQEEPLLPGRPLLFVSPAYLAAVAAAGGVPVVLPLCPEDPAPWLDRLGGLLVPGNEKPLPARVRARSPLPPLREQHPARYDSDAGWIRGALARGMPVLAVCRGMQTLNEVLGGRLADLPPAEAAAHRRSAHPLAVAGGSLLAQLVGQAPLQVNSFHVQAVAEPGRGLRVSAWAPGGVVEAVEAAAPGAFCLGVQFHPEALVAEEPRLCGIFQGLVAAARAFTGG